MGFRETELARYAAIFAADAGTEALYYGDRITDEVATLCLAIAQEAVAFRDLALSRGEDFYPMAFVEAAARALSEDHSATLLTLIEAGEAEVDMIKGGR
jgi:hypothetical protein